MRERMCWTVVVVRGTLLTRAAQIVTLATELLFFAQNEHLPAGRKFYALSVLVLDARKVLGHGIVVTVTSATHTGNQIARLQKTAPIGAAVL